MENRYAFAGGEVGEWRVTGMSAPCGAALPMVDRIAVVDEHFHAAPSADWCLRGVVSNLRYATRTEVDTLKAIQPALSRPEATCAALIPIRKSAEWWALAQDDRRAIFEDHSRHTQTGLEYLPAIARKLHHCRDLSGESFDFLTWFEFAPHHKPLFEQLLARLRASREWTYVEREVDIRLERVV